MSSRDKEIVVGSPGYDKDNNESSGAAYLFSEPNRGWRNVTATSTPIMLYAGDGAAGDAFGSASAIGADGTVAVVGAPGHDSGKGAAYAFSAPSAAASIASWGDADLTQSAKLSASDGAAGDKLGSAAAVSQDGALVAVGAPGDDSGKGAAYLFFGNAYVSGTAQTYASQLKLTASDGAAGDEFGTSVSIKPRSVRESGTFRVIGSAVAVGAPGDDSGKGAVYWYDVPSGTQTSAPTPVKVTAPDGAAGDRFGESVFVVDGGNMLVGAPGRNDGRGAVYWVARVAIGTIVATGSTYTAPDGEPGDEFGSSISAISGALGFFAVIGAPGDDFYDDKTGAVYVFRGTSDAAKLVAANTGWPESNARFGASVASSYSSLVAGAPAQMQGEMGLASVYDIESSRWRLRRSVEVLPARVRETASGSAFADFTVRLSRASAKTVTVEYTTANGSATAGSDYVAASGTLVFAPGDTEKTARIKVMSDSSRESEETFTLALRSPSNAELRTGRSSAEGAIVDRATHEIAVSKTSLAFALDLDDTPSQTLSFDAWNAGEGGLTLALSDDADWLTLSTSSETSNGATDRKTVSATANVANMHAGSHTATITISATDVPDVEVSVSAAVTGDARLAASKSALAFTLDLDDAMKQTQTLSFDVYNRGENSLTFTVSDNADWLTVLPASGTSTGGANRQTVNATANVAGLYAGAHAAAITISAAGVPDIEVSVSLTVTGDPRLAASETALSFSLDMDDATKHTQTLTFEVWNGGEGSLTFSVSDNADWLTVSPASETSTGGANRKTVSATANVAGLYAGSHSATITISAPSVDDVTVSVSLTVTGNARLATSKTALAFSLDLDDTSNTTQDLTFDVWNAGSSSLNFNVSDNATWLDVSPTSATSTGGTDRVTVTATADIDGLALGSYPATITISADSVTDATVSVSFAVTRSPRLATSQTSLAFSLDMDDPTKQTQALTFDVWNAGEGSVTFSVSDNADWLTLSPSSETSTGAADRETVTATANVAGLYAGAHAAAITISAPGVASATVSVSLTVTGDARLAVSRTSLPAFFLDMDDPTRQTQTFTFDVWNAGEGSLTFSVSDNADWLTVSPSSETSTGGADRKTVSATANVAGLYAGAHAAAITVSAPGTASATVNVSLTVSGSPRLATSESALAFTLNEGAASQTLTFAVWNAGAGSLTFSVSDDADWLTVAPASATSDGGTDRETVTAAASAAGLSAGSHDASP